MKIRITGHSKGLGKKLYVYYKSKNHNVKGFDSGYDYEKIVKEYEGCDLFINNANPNPHLQLNLLKDLHTKVKKMIVCGSVITDNDDDTPDPEYAFQKKLLEKEFLILASKKMPDNADLLLLKISSSSYKDSETILKTIDFWIKSPTVISITYNVTD